MSGFENEVREIMLKELKKYSDSVEVDCLGNVIAKKGNTGKKIMIAAHMDEIGLMVKYIDKEGYLNFVKIGGIDNRIFPHQRVVIKNKDKLVDGVVGFKPPHLLKDEDKKKILEHSEMFIDIGAKNKKEAERIVKVGDPVSFEPNFGRLNDRKYFGKAIDNRLGCYTLIKTMERLPRKTDYTIYAVGTSQEEVGLKGARVVAFRLNPDYAIVLDTTIAGDTPQIKENESSLKLGKGPAITITEASGRGVITHPNVVEIFEKTSKSSKIPYQIDVIEGGMTDAAVIYSTREGIPSGVISIPARYLHGPTSVFDMNDVDNTIKLVVKSLDKFK